MLPRVVRRGSRRVAAVIRGQDEQVPVPQRVEQVRKAPVEVLETAVEVDRVVSVAPEHVRLDEVHEDQPVVELSEQPLCDRDPLHVRACRMRLVDVEPGEDVVDLPDAVHLVPGVPHERQVVRLARLQRPVVAVGRPRVVAGLTLERPRDHPADGVLAGEDVPRGLGSRVQLLQRDRVRVGGDLKDAVTGRVDDPLPRLLVLLAELVDDLGARRGLVADHSPPRPVRERVDDVEREAVRVRRKGLRGDDAHELPVARRRVLPLRAFEQPAGDRRRTRLRRATLELLDVAQPQRLETRQIEPADCLGDVAERVGALVPVLGRIRQLSGPDGVEDDDARPWHGGILNPLWKPFSGSSAWSSTSSGRSRSPPA